MGLIGFTAVHLDEALKYLQDYGAETRILAGGTDLLVRYHGRLDELDRVMNICELDDLKSIRVVEDHIEIGSLVTHAQLEESEIIQKYVPFLAEAAGTVGAPQIRHRGTIGGNIANASPAGDTLPPLVTLEAHIKLQSAERGEVVIPLVDFLMGPGKNLLQDDELITGVIFPIPESGFEGAFVKLGQRKALAISVVNAAVMLRLQDQVVEDCRICLGAVAPTPIRALKTEEALCGKVISPEVLEQALAGLKEEITPIDDLRGSRQYRYDTARELVQQGIQLILNRGGGSSE